MTTTPFVTIGNIELIPGPPGPPGPNTIPTAEVINAALAPFAKTAEVTAGLSTFAAEQVAPVARLARRSRAIDGLRFAIENGITTAFDWRGDSTGDSSGANAADLRTPTRLAALIAAARPNAMVLSKKWNATSETFDNWVTIQEQAAGRAHAKLAGRSVRWKPAVPVAVGNVLDIDMIVAANDWTPAANQTLACQMIGTRTYATDFAWRLILKPSGVLSLVWYEADGTNAHQNLDSSVPVPGTDGQPLEIRATLEVVPGTSQTIKFYTRALGGPAWTQLGTTITQNNSFGALNPNSTAFVEVGALGWQPAGDPFQGKVYEVNIRKGINGPTVAPSLPQLWERYGDASTTYEGVPTVYLVNASHSGSDLAYHRDATRLPKMTPDYGQQTVFFNDSHNEVAKAGVTDWLTPYKAWVDSVIARLQNAVPVAVLQNPHTSAWPNEAAYGVTHVTRLRELGPLAARERWGTLDLFTAFMRDPRGLNELIADGLHPTQVGYALAAATAFAMLGI